MWTAEAPSANPTWAAPKRTLSGRSCHSVHHAVSSPLCILHRGPNRTVARHSCSIYATRRPPVRNIELAVLSTRCRASPHARTTEKKRKTRRRRGRAYEANGGTPNNGPKAGAQPQETHTSHSTPFGTRKLWQRSLPLPAFSVTPLVSATREPTRAESPSIFLFLFFMFAFSLP